MAAPALRGRSITLSLLRASSLLRPRSDIIFPTATLAIAVFLTIALVTRGPERKAFLQTSYTSAANLIERLATGATGLFKHPAAPAESDGPLRRSLAEIGCKLKLQEGALTVSAMDDCILTGSLTPDQVFAYISGDGLGTSKTDARHSGRHTGVRAASEPVRGTRC